MPKKNNEKQSPDASKPDLIYDTLVQAILSRELVPGMKLSEEIVGDIFHVSRTLVRAALNRLHSESLVTFQKNRGAFVSTPSMTEAREVFYVRILLEKDAALRLAQTITPAQCGELEANILAHRTSYREGNEADSMRQSEEFHILMARMAGNAVLATLLERLITRSVLALSFYSRQNRSECGIDEHVAILKALKDGDGTTAAEVMGRHLEQVVVRAQLAGNDTDARTLQTILSRYLGGLSE